MGNCLKTWKDQHCLNMGLICINTYNTLPVMHIACCMFTSRINMYAMYYTGADPGFQAGRGVLKKIAPSGGRRENCWGISCEKSRFYAKNYILSNFRGAPAWIHPAIYVWSVCRIDDLLTLLGLCWVICV